MLCHGPQYLFHPCSQVKESSVCFQHVTLRNELDVLGLGLQCWIKGNLKAMLLEYLFLGSEISVLSLFYLSRTITLLHKVELSRKVARAPNKVEV